MPLEESSRPPVTVVVPFYGDPDAARRAITALEALETRTGDELFLVDNTEHGTLEAIAPASGPTVICSPVPRSAYAARNVGAEAGTCPWILFLDADCRPSRTLLDDYFAESIAESSGAISGEIAGNAEQSGLAARWARARGQLSLEASRRHPYLPAAVTANLLVRRSVWEELGGFHEGMRAAAGDIDFAWRLQIAGWALESRPGAVVVHSHRDSLGSLLRQVARNGAGAAWLNRRHAGSLPRRRVIRSLARSCGASLAYGLSGRRDDAALKLVDALALLAESLGRLADNRPARPLAGIPPWAIEGVVLVVDSFPSRSDATTVEEITALAHAGHRVRVEAAKRPADPDWPAGREVRVDFWEDDGPARWASDAAWLSLRHPLRTLAEARNTNGAAPGQGSLTRLAPAARRAARGAESRLTAASGDAQRRAAALRRLLGRS